MCEGFNSSIWTQRTEATTVKDVESLNALVFKKSVISANLRERTEFAALRHFPFFLFSLFRTVSLCSSSLRLGFRCSVNATRGAPPSAEGLLLDLGIVPIFAEIMNVLNKAVGKIL